MKIVLDRWRIDAPYGPLTTCAVGSGCAVFEPKLVKTVKHNMTNIGENQHLENQHTHWF
jgi:hypothetical protein